MKDIGKMIFKISLESKFGLTQVVMREDILTQKKKGLEYIFGEMEISIQENGKMVYQKAMEFIYGMTVEYSIP